MTEERDNREERIEQAADRLEEAAERAELSAETLEKAAKRASDSALGYQALGGDDEIPPGDVERSNDD